MGIVSGGGGGGGGLRIPTDVTGGDTRVQIDAAGTMTLTGASIMELLLQEGDSLQNTDLTSAGVVSLLANSPSLTARNLASGFQCGVKDIGLYINVNAAPSNGSLFANECLLWFDSTNGAAKLMAKGKTADGTVVAASVAMA